MQTLEPTSSQAAFSMEEWRSGYRSQPQEYAYWIDDIEGEIPADLEGTLYRNGPGLLDINGYPIRHPFDGDGMINSFAFKNGRAFYRNRFVRTEGYVAEQTAGKPLYRGVFGTQKPGGVLANAFDLRLKNIANTHIIYWGDRLLALWEAAEPHRLDPVTLETIGLDFLGGQLEPGDSFTAHPKVDPGHYGQPRLVGFSVDTGVSSQLTLYEFDIAGELITQHSHSLPGFAFLHDFALTPNYAIFFQNPVSFNPLGYLLGFHGAAQSLAFDPKAKTKVVLIPRNDRVSMQIIETDPCFVFHHSNAFEQDGQVVVDSICYSEFPSLKGGDDYKHVNFDEVPGGQLWRFTLDLAAQSARSDCLMSRSVEFPVLHPDRVGYAHRYSYIGAVHSPEGNAPLQAVLKKDWHTGEEQLASFAPHGFGGEPVFIPRPGGMDEDDGWLMLLVYDGTRRCSDLVIMDGQNITREIARLKLKHHIPYGLHGSFAPVYFGPEDGEA
ncbi:Apocarotenoid-15,15'-oxygenase [filamentous cyanobacterium CCP5]|nr:Apocarotenoid-15,15'-oxygenase [filamentous cyanobacterium CCP5]